MHFLKETGVILFVKDYERSRVFYRDQVGLPVRYEKENLTCFQFGGSYLLVESLWGEKQLPIPNNNSPVLRLNVEDINAALQDFKERGIDAAKMEFEWGIIGQFKDPDGYAVELCQWPKELYERHPPIL
jgi:lactoylglutathione lyase